MSLPVRGGRRAANLVTQDDLHDAYAVVAGVDVHGGGVVGGAVADAAGVQGEAAGAVSEDETQEDAGIGKAVAGPSDEPLVAGVRVAEDEAEPGPSMARQEVVGADEVVAGPSEVQTGTVKLQIGCPGLTLALRHGSDLSALKGWYVVAGRATDYERRPEASHILPLRAVNMYVRSENKRGFVDL